MNYYDGNNIRDIILYSIEHDDTIHSLVEKLNHNFDQILRYERTDFMDVVVKSVLQSIANGEYSDILGSNGQKVIMIGKPGRDGRDGMDGDTIVQTSQSTKFLPKRTSDLREIQQNSYSINIPQNPELESERVALLKYRPGDIVFTKNGDLMVVENITDQEIFFTRKINYQSLSGGGSSSGGSGGTSSASSKSFLIDTDVEGSRVKEHILQSTERILLGIHNPSQGESNANTRYFNLGLGIGKHAFGNPALAISNIPQTMTSDANAVDSGLQDQARFYFRRNSQQSFDESSPRFWSFLRYIDLYEDQSNRSAVTGQKLRFGLENSDPEDNNQPFWELLTDKRSKNSSFTSFTNMLSVSDPNTKMSIILDNRQTFSIKTSKNGVEKKMFYVESGDTTLSTDYQHFHAPVIQTNTIAPKTGDVVSVQNGKYFYSPKVRTDRLVGADAGKLHISDNTMLTVDEGSEISIAGKLLTKWVADSDRKIKEFESKKMRINTLFTNTKTETSGFEIDLRNLGFPLFEPSGDSNMWVKSAHEGISHSTSSLSHIYLPIFTKTSVGSVSKYTTLHRLFGIFTYDDTDDLSGTPFANVVNENKFIWDHYGKKNTAISKSDALASRINDLQRYVRIPVFDMSNGDVSYSHILFPKIEQGGTDVVGKSLVVRSTKNKNGDYSCSVELEKKNRVYYLKLHPEMYNDPEDKNQPSGFKLYDGWYAFEYDVDNVNTYQKTKFDSMRIDLQHSLRYGNESTYDQGFIDSHDNMTTIKCNKFDGGSATQQSEKNGMILSGTFSGYDESFPNICDHFVSMLQHGTYFLYRNSIENEHISLSITTEDFQNLYNTNRGIYPNYYHQRYEVNGSWNNLFMPLKFRRNLKNYPFSDRSLNCVPCNTKNYSSVYNPQDGLDRQAYSNDMFSIKVVGDVVYMDIYVECSVLCSTDSNPANKRFAYQRYGHCVPRYMPQMSTYGDVHRNANRFFMIDTNVSHNSFDSVVMRTVDGFMPNMRHMSYYLHDKTLYQHTSTSGKKMIYSDSGFNFPILIPTIIAPITDIMFADNTTIYSDDLCSVSVSPYHHSYMRDYESDYNNTNVNKRAVMNIRTSLGSDRHDTTDNVRNRGTSQSARLYDEYGTEFSGFTTLFKKGFGHTLNNAIDLGFSPNNSTYTPIMVSFRNPNDEQQLLNGASPTKLVVPRNIEDYVVQYGTGVKFKKISLSWVKPGLSEILDSRQMRSMDVNTYDVRPLGVAPSYSNHSLYSSLLHESLEKHDVESNKRYESHLDDVTSSSSGSSNSGSSSTSTSTGSSSGSSSSGGAPSTTSPIRGGSGAGGSYGGGSNGNHAGISTISDSELTSYDGHEVI